MNHSTLGELLEKDMINGRSPSIDSTSLSPQSLVAKIDRFLNAFWGFSPNLKVAAEHDSNHNGSMKMLSQSLYFYVALFDCVESTFNVSGEIKA